MKRLLITGASGYLGWHCCNHLKHGWRTYGVGHQNQNGIHPNAIGCLLDLTDKDALWHLLKKVKPDAVFHLAAHSGTGYCEAHPEESRLLNVNVVEYLAEMCSDLKSRLLFTSSEQVFDGHKGQYSEADTPCPKNKYGEQKWEAEQLIQAIYPEAVILRIAVLYGQSTPAAKSFLNQWLDAWSKLLSVTAFHDETRQFLSAASCAEALFHLLSQGAEGVFHVGGEMALTRFDFGKIATDVLTLQHAKMESLGQKDAEMPAFRPADLSLDLSKIKSTGFVPIHPVAELKSLKPFLKIEPDVSLN